MSLGLALFVIVFAAAVAGCIALLVQRWLSVEFRRHHHDVGSTVFLQLGAVFAVLVAFVFSQVWGEYNTASQAINNEVRALQAAALVASTLPIDVAQPILRRERAYVDSVVSVEWPVLARHGTEDPATARKLEVLIGGVLDLRQTDPVEQGKKALIETMLLRAHAARETRIYQAANGIPGPLWAVLIAFTVMLSLSTAFSTIQYRATALVISMCFTAAIVSILMIVHLFDYPFEGALALGPGDFLVTAQQLAVLHGRMGGG